jgi:hypothetical protein
MSVGSNAPRQAKPVPHSVSFEDAEGRPEPVWQAPFVHTCGQDDAYAKRNTQAVEGFPWRVGWEGATRVGLVPARR